MSPRIVVFGATGYTGRLTAERLVADGERPLLAGRSQQRLDELAERLGGGLERRVADVDRPDTVAALLEPGDVLLSTVGPFVRWGEPALRAAIAARSAGSPQRLNGPTVLSSTSPRPTSAATLSGRSTSATRHSSPPSRWASSVSFASERPASSGRSPWARSRSAVRRPVYPVAPKTTIRAGIRRPYPAMLQALTTEAIS